MPEAVISQAAQTVLIRISPLLAEWNFYLGGGTGLALQLGHRFSDDLDFFRTLPFHAERFAACLREQVKRFETLVLEQNTLVILVDGTRLGCFRYEVPLSFPLQEWEGIRLADWRDLLAEKLKTVSQRGSKKDFFDLYELFTQHLPIAEGVAIFKARFADTGINLYHVLRSLTYFEEADGEPDPRLLNRDYRWDEVQRFFIDHIQEFEQAMIKV